MLGGISQATLLIRENRLGGFNWLPCWIPFRVYLSHLKQAEPIHEAIRHFNFQRLETCAASTASTLGTPLLIALSCDDTTIEIEYGGEARDPLRALDIDVRWNQHQVANMSCVRQLVTKISSAIWIHNSTVEVESHLNIATPFTV